jgi:hypothetical protein
MPHGIVAILFLQSVEAAVNLAEQTTMRSYA